MSFLRPVFHCVLNIFQGGSLHALSGVQNLTPFMVKVFFLLSNQKIMCLLSSQEVVAESSKVSPELSLLQGELTQLFQPLPVHCVLCPSPWSAWSASTGLDAEYQYLLCTGEPKSKFSTPDLPQHCQTERGKLTFLDLLAPRFFILVCN